MASLAKKSTRHRCSAPGRRARPVVAAAALLFWVMLGASGWGLPPLDRPEARAHTPVLEPEQRSDAAPDPATAVDPFPGAHEIPDPSVSRAVYGVLAEDEEFDAYRFRVPQSITIPVSILVPKRGDLAAFRPEFALIGPGLDGATGIGSVGPPLRARLETAGVDSPDLDVLVVSAPSERWGSFFEPFSFERYFEGPEVQVSLEPEKDYYVVVFHPQQQQGDYVLGLGTREAFGLGDIVRSIVAVARIKLGLYGQGEIRWGALLLGLAAVAIVVAIAAALVIGVRRRRRRRRGPLATSAGPQPPDAAAGR